MTVTIADFNNSMTTFTAIYAAWKEAQRRLCQMFGFVNHASGTPRNVYHAKIYFTTMKLLTSCAQTARGTPDTRSPNETRSNHSALPATPCLNRLSLTCLISVWASVRGRVVCYQGVYPLPIVSIGVDHEKNKRRFIERLYRVVFKAYRRDK